MRLDAFKTPKKVNPQKDVDRKRGKLTFMLSSAAVLTVLRQLTSSQSLNVWTKYGRGNRAALILPSSAGWQDDNNRTTQSPQLISNVSFYKEEEPQSRDLPELDQEVSINHKSHPLFASLISNHYPDNDIRSIYDQANLKVQNLQPWLIDYLKWHDDMRKQFPGPQLFDNPLAPKVLIKVCVESGHVCGGLNDRMKVLPVYIAAKTNRILLYKWIHPFPLEEFLIPNVVDWTVPNSTTIPINDAEYLKSKLLDFSGWNPRESRYANSYRRLQADPLLTKEKVVTLNHGADALAYIKDERARNNIPESHEEYGTLWHLLFKPSPPVEKEIMDVMTKQGLVVQQFVATHVRVRHPARRNFLKDSTALVSKNGKNGESDVDRFGLEFEGKARDMMIDVGTHAVNCTNLLRDIQEESIYFYSDSEDLVTYMASEANREVESDNGNNNTSPSEQRSRAVKKLVSPGKIVGRDLTKKTVHLDREDAPDVSFFYGTFIDLYLGIAARCVSFGVGNYALLSTRISNTQCQQTHERLKPRIARMWGAADFGNASHCPLPVYEATMR